MTGTTRPPEANAPRRVRPGDLWRLGPHRLLCGDSTDPAQVKRLLGGERARLTITSPPYNAGSSASLSRPAFGSARYVGGSDTRPNEEYLRLLTGATENALMASEVAVINLQQLAGNKVALAEWLYRFRHDLIDTVVWDKGSAPPAMKPNVLNSRFEYLFFLTGERRRGITPRTIPTAGFRGTVANVYQGPPRRRNPYFRLHAATFPLHLPLWLMGTFDMAAGAVFDPFLGTGTTLMAAERLGRRCFGMEVEPRYCDIAVGRYERETGTRAERVLG